ncbi:MAG: hypothetical protein H8D67_30980 [Deltaproteobacteria bacterium]|nr:hypothetical protein [Deltaproteobacteria bacterium]
MELWAIVLENKDESGGKVKAVGFIRSNLVKQAKEFKKEAKTWQRIVISKIKLESASELLINFAVDRLLEWRENDGSL